MHRCPDVRMRADRLLVLGLVALAVTATGCGSSSSTSPTPASRSQSATSAASAPSTASSSARPTGSATPQNVMLKLTGKRPSFTLAGATAQALTNAGVQVHPVAPATAPSPGVISLPVIGGTLTQVGLAGNGQLQLTAWYTPRGGRLGVFLSLRMRTSVPATPLPVQRAYGVRPRRTERRKSIPEAMLSRGGARQWLRGARSARP